MKKALKILGYLLLGVLLFAIGAVIFFTSKYDKASEAINEREKVFAETDVSFYRFEMETDSVSEWILLPVPKRITPRAGNFAWPAQWEIVSDIPKSKDWVERLLEIDTDMGDNTASIQFLERKDLKSESYEFTIGPKGIEIHYADEAGAYYAVISLYHLKKQFPDTVESVQVFDQPDLSIRGFMLDISRDKVPQLQTLKSLVDKLSLLKYNHLQLYVEGFSFGYPSFKGLWEGKETPLTPEEIKALDSYCSERFIELVPNQNSLGHMQPWLETSEYAHLAECPDGYEIMPMQKVKTTLDVSNEESIELIEQMMDDMLPNFSSGKFNANLDEPFELGHCNNSDLAEEVGVGQLYLDFVVKVYELAKDRGKEFWMWGDIIGKHPELLDSLPSDITVLEWGYEAEHPFANNTERIKQAGFNFLVCPGTSSWMTLTGRTDNMLGNIENAVLNGIENGARGMLLTDWGDLGHWQYLPISYPGIAYAGAISWNGNTSRNLSLERYLNNYIFEEKHRNLGEIVMDMGQSYHYEEFHMPNSSLNFWAYQFGISNPVLQDSIYGAIEKKIPELIGDSLADILVQSRFQNRKRFEEEALHQHLDKIESDLNYFVDEKSLSGNTMGDGEKNQTENQLRNGIQMVRLGAEMRKYSAQKEDWTSEERLAHLTTMKDRLNSIQEEHRRLWLIHNKEGGLDRSMKSFRKLDTELERLIKVEGGSAFGKKMERLKEKVVGGAVNWFLEE